MSSDGDMQKYPSVGYRWYFCFIKIKILLRIFKEHIGWIMNIFTFQYINEEIKEWYDKQRKNNI